MIYQSWLQPRDLRPVHLHKFRNIPYRFSRVLVIEEIHLESRIEHADPCLPCDAPDLDLGQELADHALDRRRCTVLLRVGVLLTLLRWHFTSC